MAKNKGTFNRDQWNCFESFAAYSEYSRDEQICTDVLRGAGITKREAEAQLDKPVQRNARAEHIVRDYLNEHCCWTNNTTTNHDTAMYFGKDHSPSCDEVCTNCGHTACIDHPDHARAKRLEWEGEPRTCAFCGQTFIPTSPAQRYCSREKNPACEDERFFSSLSPIQFIRFHGYSSKEEFIKDNGQDAWETLQKSLPTRKPLS